MKVLIALPMYDTKEICDELAKLTGKKEPYSRTRVDFLIQIKLPTAQKLGNRYYLTEKELGWLAKHVRAEKRPKKY